MDYTSSTALSREAVSANISEDILGNLGRMRRFMTKSGMISLRSMRTLSNCLIEKELQIKEKQVDEKEKMKGIPGEG